jgi:hypothetical protein
MPNLGINLATISLGYTFYFKPLEFNEAIEKIRWKKKNSELYLMGVGSLREVYPTGGRKYPIASMSLMARKQFFPKFGVELIGDFFYNSSRSASEPQQDEVPHWDLVETGIYAGVFMPVSKVDFLVGMGTYIKNEFNLHGLFYHRFGFRYRILDKWMLNMTIKAHLGRADYFEYGIAYKLF